MSKTNGNSGFKYLIYTEYCINSFTIKLLKNGKALEKLNLRFIEEYKNESRNELIIK